MMVREKQKLETKKKLLDTAFHEFSRKGFLGTKTLDIAQSANVSHGSVFVHYPTKEALLLAVIQEFGMQLGTQFEKKIKEGTLEQVLTIHLNVLQKWEPFYTQLVICGPHLPEEIRTEIFNIQSGIAYYLEKALKNQKLDIKFPLHLMMNSWMGLVHYYLANRDLFTQKSSVLAAKGKELIQYFNQLINGERK